MKRSLIILAIFVLAAEAVPAQQINSFIEPSVKIGPRIGIKGGVNAIGTPSGRRNGLLISNIPDIGLNAYIPLSSDSPLGAIIGMSYSTYSYKIIRHEDDYEYDHRYSYLLVSPNIAFDFLRAGFNFGIPMSAEYGEDIDTDALNLMVEFEIGAEFELWGDETGSFNAFIGAGLMLTGIYNDYKNNDPLLDAIPPHDPETIVEIHNHRAASVKIGFSYLFSI